MCASIEGNDRGIAIVLPPRETDPRNGIYPAGHRGRGEVYRGRKGRGVGMHHRRVSGWFLSFELPPPSPPQPHPPPDTVERREMHSCGNTSCHSRRPPRDNKLSGLRIGRKQRAVFHMQNTYSRLSRSSLEPRSRARARAKNPYRRSGVKNDLADNRCCIAPRRRSFALFPDRSLCLDRSIALSGRVGLNKWPRVSGRDRVSRINIPSAGIKRETLLRKLLLGCLSEQLGPLWGI